MAKKAAKATAVETEQRITEVFQLLIRCTPYHAIVRYGATKWGIGSRQVDNLIKRAKEQMMAQYLRKTRDEIWSEEMAARDDLYRKAYEDRKWGICLEIKRDRAKLARLYEPVETHEEGEAIISINLGEAETTVDSAESEEV